MPGANSIALLCSSVRLVSEAWRDEFRLRALRGSMITLPYSGERNKALAMFLLSHLEYLHHGQPGQRHRTSPSLPAVDIFN